MKHSGWLWVVVLWGGLAVPLPGQPSGQEEEEPEVIGVEVSRGDGGYLGLAVEGNAFVVRFYDEEKKGLPVPPHVARAVVHWNAVQKAGRQRVVLVPSGDLLRSPPRVRPPYAFIAYLILFEEEGETVESHAVNMRQFERATSKEDSQESASGTY